MAVERQSSALPPAQPSYILRGHASQIHNVQFVRQNTRLLTGDADGWVVFWKVETKRALAVWKAHDGAILGTAEWGNEKIITHGRDNSLRIWQLRPADESALPTVLPAENAADQQSKPWLLHTLPVNTLNFCAFSMCFERPPETNRLSGITPDAVLPLTSDDSILVAVPARDDKKMEVYRFPDEKLRFVVPRVQPTDTGMAMAVRLVHHAGSNNILVLAGFEGGLTTIHRLPQNKSSGLELAQLVYLSKPHTQPILSLDVSPDARFYFTSSADATIAAHRIPELTSDVENKGFSSTDEQNGNAPFFPTPGEEASTSAGTEPFPSQENLPSKHPLNLSAQDDPPPGAELSTTPANPLEFGKQPISSAKISAAPPAGLSSLLSSAPPLPRMKPTPAILPNTTIQPPFKTSDTKHSGQQSLRVRSDGRLLVTGGWDSRIRIYSAKTLKEVAVLKWHKEGVYAVDFGAVLGDGDVRGGGQEVCRKETGLGKLQRQREEQMQRKHWVVAGAKDGKVSLWEVF
ncbi:WD40 repeat-like protein [Dothidotthia symphoricarpi CBS 119687]|uniref:ASTRA-associated protein 1 n=1 Tax=Dothidotthia symphoricarpi CBS 119687 TaxID=1392245 RepID=A0A6A6ACF7_9PLEO|nr:WD40 repeat-like protein [Dothidotthia symphoricarpi CBS 119687]KAF2129470.1 WD40 repeat-like protein [Dothidotthia symphoricarpi CBS 119687]